MVIPMLRSDPRKKAALDAGVFLYDTIRGMTR